MIQRKRCLLIATLHFYSFPSMVANALVARGYEVDVMNEEYPANSFGRILAKISLGLTRKLTFRALRDRLNSCQRYDLILVIKGRGLGPDAIKYLKTRGDRIVAYNYDSFSHNPSPLDWYSLVDRYATFDVLDSEEYGLPLVHLFCASEVQINTPKLYDYSIIQRVHSDRLLVTYSTLKALSHNTAGFVYLYESSLLLFMWGVVRSPLLYVVLWPYIYFKPLPYSMAMKALAASRVTVDYALPDQTGITMRCFEARSLGVTILTNNRSAVDSGLFEKGSVSLMPNNFDIDIIRERVNELILRSPMPQNRGINEFLDDLLGN